MLPDPGQLLELARPFLRIAAIWLLALTALVGLRHLLALKRRLLERMDQQRDGRRTGTLFNVLRHAANLVVLGIALLMTLGELGMSITPILATAGVAGIAVGFGAQSLVKDFFTGLCLLAENQMNEGDLIEVAGKSGVVERITLRHVRLRDYDGSVHFIPNSIITALTNRSRDFAYAVIDLNLPRDADLERVFAHMRQVAEEMRQAPLLRGAVLDAIDIAGVERLDDAVLSVRCRLKVAPARQWRVRREFLRRIRPLLDLEKADRSAGKDQKPTS